MRSWFFQIPFVMHLVVVTLGLKSLHKLKVIYFMPFKLPETTVDLFCKRSQVI